MVGDGGHEEYKQESPDAGAAPPDGFRRCLVWEDIQTAMHQTHSFIRSARPLQDVQGRDAAPALGCTDIAFVVPPLPASRSSKKPDGPVGGFESPRHGMRMARRCYRRVPAQCNGRPAARARSSAADPY